MKIDYDTGVKIRMLRKRGYGYTKIANELGFPHYTIRNYCARKGLNSHLKLDTAESWDPNFCKECGRPIVQPLRGKRKKFCSYECRKNWWRKHRDQKKQEPKSYYHLICNYCHKPFDSYANPNRKYCSHECYILDRYYNKKIHNEDACCKP